LPAGENARANLPGLLREYAEQGSALGNSAPEAAFHKFRLNTKKLRYLLEIFRPCYGGELKALLKCLRTVQDHLGAMNDCVTTRQLAAPRLPVRSAARRNLERFLARRSEQNRAAFLRHWKRTLGRPGYENRWTGFLRAAPSDTG
jgi:CHAD domain-containing protein